MTTCGCGLERSGPLPRYDLVGVLNDQDYLHLLPSVADAIVRATSPELEILCGDPGLITSFPLEHVIYADIIRSIYGVTRAICPVCLETAQVQTVFAHDVTPGHLFHEGAS